MTVPAESTTTTTTIPTTSAPSKIKTFFTAGGHFVVGAIVLVGTFVLVATGHATWSNVEPFDIATASLLIGGSLGALVPTTKG